MGIEYFLVALLTVLFVVITEIVILLLLFRKKNALATKIVKRLMKTQVIPYRKTMTEVDDAITKLVEGEF